MNEDTKDDKIFDSLDNTPEVEAKQPKSKPLFWKNKQNVLSFIAGMVIILIFCIIFTTTVDPKLLTGTAVNNADIVKYKMFPSQIGTVQSSSSTKYMGELALFAHNFLCKDFYYLCDGSKINIESNSYLYSLYGKRFGGDGIETMGLPNLRDKFPTIGMDYYMIGAFGTYPFYEHRNDTIIKDGILYAPYDASHYPNNRRAVETETFLGEISLYKTSDESKYKDIIIPCEGQKLEIAKYPKLSKYMGDKFGRDDKTFTLPDLRNMSPIPDAKYCISPYGNDWYMEVVPAGYMKCIGCKKIVQKSKFCMECGTQN